MTRITNEQAEHYAFLADFAASAILLLIPAHERLSLSLVDDNRHLAEKIGKLLDSHAKWHNDRSPTQATGGK